ncbi:hypothetical protein J6S55_00350 [Candidatus Saccharibacteria bacterium]|nr:hypothetical protein [Candidatus Saccharibacteria bacterium]
MMIRIRNLKNGIRNKVFGCLFALVVMLSSLFGMIPGTSKNVYAEPEEKPAVGATCEDSLGSLGWLVCPSTGKISEAVDFLYDKTQDVLEVNPVEPKDGSPIFEIWKYFQGVTNVLFIVFLLVVVFSQITGVGITNYGVKKALPKLIIAAILVNLSFYICSLAVDVSNIFGDGLRGLFESIESSITPGVEGEVQMTGVKMSEMYSAISGGTSLAIGGALIAFETGAIWMLIPLAFGALVSVVIGLVTIAMRQAVVTLLIMIAPLAMVAYILPNTEQWFKKWRQLLFQMLIFYPAFSLLFGASSIAGWAIIVSSQNGFGVLIGVAVQIFPLFFAWSLMKMSGTFLSTVNAKLNGLASGAVGGVRGWATSHQELSKQKHLASPNAYTPSLKLRQFLSDRKIARDEETKEHMETVKNRGLAYSAMRNYTRKGLPSKEGEESYEAQARNAEYQNKILRHKNNMNKGMGQLEALKKNGTRAQKARLSALDSANVKAFDKLKMEQARGERIDYKNAVGFRERMEAAMNAHMDATHGTTTDADGRRIASSKYKRHFEPGSLAAVQAADRYTDLSKIMEGDVVDTHYAVAAAAQAYDTQAKVMATKMQKYFELTPPTKDVMYRLDELTKIADDMGAAKAADNIDAIISGLRVLNMRGDTDLVKEQMDNILNKNIGGGLQLGTHASQALASFLMFEVKDNDPLLRRFGKYINLETASVYNKGERKVLDFTYDEYIKGYHDGEPDLITDKNPTGRMYAKKDIIKLAEGTSLDNIERTAFSNLDESLKRAYGYNGDDAQWDVAGWLKKREEIQTALEPAFLSASLKWLSGSEQINSAVKFWTGYELKQKKDSDGNPILEDNEPTYALTPVWGKGFKGRDKDGNDKDFSDDVEKYYRRKTNDYFKDQTTGQILGMRTDYRDATMEHLLATYLDGLESKNEDPEEREMYDERKAEYAKREAEIQTRYGDMDKDKANELRKKDLKALKMEFAGRQVRKILGETGKLEQIYRTRRSGAANNAKDWLRKWVNLDDEETMAKEVKYYENLRKLQRDEEKKGDSNDSEEPTVRIYDAGTRQSFRDILDKEYHDHQDMDTGEFYGLCLDLLEEWFGENTSLVEKEFKEYYEQQVKNRTHIEPYNLKQNLEDLLQDESKYPDA